MSSTSRHIYVQLYTAIDMTTSIEQVRKFLRTCVMYNYNTPFIILTVDTYNDFVRREVIQWFWSNKNHYYANGRMIWPELVKYVNLTWKYAIEATEGHYDSDITKQCAHNVDKCIRTFKQNIKITNEHVNDHVLMSDKEIEKLQGIWNRLCQGNIKTWIEGM